jgi:drug/metabolite transporter (DMT)-like permease
MSAACWGAGDFCGGFASKRWPVYSVIISSQLVGVGLLIGLAVIFKEVLPPLEQLLLGGVGGLAGALGLVALYRALATGRMGVAAPIAGVVGVALPVLIGAMLDGLPGTIQTVGFGLAAFAVWIISRTDDARLRLYDLGLPLLAGLSFGVFFVIIGKVSDTAVMWPLVAARCASLGALTIVAMGTHQPRLVPLNHWRLIALIGVLEVGGNAFFALAGQSGRLDVAAVISSLYPAATVLLARLILKEHLGQKQSIGVLAALVAIVLITL